MISLNTDFIKKYVSDDNIAALQPKVDEIVKSIYDKTCAGNDFLGWVDLPETIDPEMVAEIKSIAKEIQKNSDHLITIGIGGSYLGARAAIEFAVSPFDKDFNRTIYMGHNMSSDYVYDLLNYIDDKDVYVNVISKSGTTTEPGISFRILKEKLAEKYSTEELAQRIIATTDESKGALRQVTDKERYRSFVIPDDVGGRFSVLTPVGLLPIAAAGLDIDALLDGAKSMAEFCKKNTSVLENPVLTYAAARYNLYKQGRWVEMLSSFEPNMQYVAEWWKQLYGESEGKETKGIFPSSAVFSTDLHSLGQYIQEGERQLFETFLMIDKNKNGAKIPLFEENADGMNYLAGKDFSEVNFKAYQGTSIAHLDGDVPNMTITIPEKSEYYLGQLFYFFEFAVAVSGLLIDVNPFNQPGVEAYKKNMFALLGKPGFEEMTQELEARIKG